MFIPRKQHTYYHCPLFTMTTFGIFSQLTYGTTRYTIYVETDILLSNVLVCYHSNTWNWCRDTIWGMIRIQFSVRILHWCFIGWFKIQQVSLHYGTVRSRGGACCQRPQFRRHQRCQISMETPLFVCFRTKSDVHPVRTKSLSENHFTIFEIFGKTYLTPLAQ